MAGVADREHQVLPVVVQPPDIIMKQGFSSSITHCMHCTRGKKKALLGVYLFVKITKLLCVSRPKFMVVNPCHFKLIRYRF